MRTASALILFVLVACGDARTEVDEAHLDDLLFSSGEENSQGIHGVYEMISMNGEPLPSGTVAAGSFEFRSDGKWVLSVSYNSLEGAVSSSGGFVAREERNGCTPVELWPSDVPDAKRTETICDGIMTIEPSSVSWVAVFKKRQ